MSTPPLSRLALLLATIAALAAAVVVAPARSFGSPADVHSEKQPGQPAEWMFRQRITPEEGFISPEDRKRAVAQAEQIAARTKQDRPELAAAAWQTAGPTTIGGRIVDVAVDHTQPNTVFVGAASGGVWRSTDAGATLQQAWPLENAQSIGAVAVARDGTVFAGTGEANPGGGSLTYGGTGVFRSTDRGETWEHLGLSDTSRIGRIAVDPTNADRLFVAATGNLFTPGGDRGLYRSNDRGATWELVLKGPNLTTGAVDVAIDPVNPQRMYAALWDHQRTPSARRYGGFGSGIWRSLDGGTTWTRLFGGLPTGSLGRIGIAVAPSDPQRLYAVVVASSGSFHGFYASRNAGSTWTAQGAGFIASAQSTYGWWFGRVWVDPLHAEHVFAAGIQLVESFNGGGVWQYSAASAPGTLYPVHADQHGMAWDPAVPGRVYLGNDGGLYRSQVSGLVGVEWIPAVHQPFTQFYSVDVGQQDPGMIVGGAQDNGSLRSFVGTSPSPARGIWNVYGLGDGEQNLIDYSDARYIYACSQYGNCQRSETAGDVNVGFGSTSSTRRNWFTPVEFDPDDPSIMYYAGNILNRSTNRARTWEPISPDLAPNAGGDASYPYGTATTIGPSKTDDETVYVGTDDGRLWRTRNLGRTWARVDSALPDRWVTRVVVDPTDEQTVYATFSGFRNGEDDAHVFRTQDGGVTWTAIGSGLPDAPVNDLVLIDGSIYVATDVGVYVAEAGPDAPAWYEVGANLPLVPITDMRYVAATGELFIATFGRGMYKISL